MSQLDNQTVHYLAYMIVKEILLDFIRQFFEIFHICLDNIKQEVQSLNFDLGIIVATPLINDYKKRIKDILFFLVRNQVKIEAV